jgi:hypothetical protein
MSFDGADQTNISTRHTTNIWTEIIFAQSLGKRNVNRLVQSTKFSVEMFTCFLYETVLLTRPMLVYIYRF